MSKSYQELFDLQKKYAPKKALTIRTPKTSDIPIRNPWKSFKLDTKFLPK